MSCAISFARFQLSLARSNNAWRKCGGNRQVQVQIGEGICRCPAMSFAPEICIPAVRALRHFQGGRLYGRYGFFDAFNPSFRDTRVSLRSGSVDAHLGWVDSDYLSDNQGPILGMIANYKTGILWNAIRRVPTVIRGLKRAGFTGAWLDKTENVAGQNRA
jgi:hypothetical protein